MVKVECWRRKHETDRAKKSTEQVWSKVKVEALEDQGSSWGWVCGSRGLCSNGEKDLRKGKCSTQDEAELGKQGWGVEGAGTESRC